MSRFLDWINLKKMCLETERLILRKFEDTDAERLFLLTRMRKS